MQPLLLVSSLLVAWQVALTATTPFAEAATAIAGTRIATWAVNDVHSTDDLAKRVAILTTNRDSADAWCMGLLVAPDALLTYAHCVQDKRIAWAFFGDSRASFFEAQQHVLPPSPSTPTVAPPSTPTVAPPSTPASALANDSIDRGNRAADTVHTSKRVDSGASSGGGNNSSESSAYDNSNTSSTTSSHSMNPSGSTPRTRRLDADVEVGDVPNWVAVTSVIVHPEYDPANRTASAKDWAIVRLETPREDVAPFELLPREPTVVMNRTRVFAANRFQGFRVSTAFIARATAAKVDSIGAFSRTLWRYCTLAPVNRVTLSRKVRRRDQMCAVPFELRKRVALSTINSFVLVGDQLAGVSMCRSTDCQKRVVHPFALVAGIADFIASAIATNVAWTSASLFTVGGTTAPLQGYLAGLRKTPDGPNFCLGTLIAPFTVLTAAHCVKSETVQFVSVGSLHASSVVDGEQIAVERVTIHPLFDATTLMYDFALVTLQYMSIQAPLALDNEADDALYQTTAALTLYGYSEETRDVQSLLLPLVSMSVCQALISDATVDTSTLVCAGGEEGRDGCQGDSGGPLVHEMNDGADQYLVALASYGWGCGLKGVPAVYAKVTAATRFIETNVVGHKWRFKLISSGQPTTSTDSDDYDVDDYDVDDSVDGDTSPNNGGSVTPSTMPSVRPTRSPSASEAGRSGGLSDPNKLAPANAKSVDDFIARVCAKEKWTLAPHTIALSTHLETIVIPATASHFTRDTVATTLLASAGAEVFEDDNARRRARSTYVCAGSIAMFSSADLQPIEAKLVAFEDRRLRKRAVRFVRAPGMTRLPVA